MNEQWRAVVEAGHRGGDDAAALVRQGMGDDDPAVRELALGAMNRLGQLDDDALVAALTDPAATVRRRAVELIAHRPSIDLLPALSDPDPIVVEHAAWACGEHETVTDGVLERLIELAGTSEVALVREAAVAALGAIGDQRGLPAIIAGCSDLPAVRRRAVLALAPFEGDDVEATIERALVDRDWQVRQAAEDLRRATAD
jgi:HEAT repeat protein